MSALWSCFMQICNIWNCPPEQQLGNFFGAQVKKSVTAPTFTHTSGVKPRAVSLTVVLHDGNQMSESKCRGKLCKNFGPDAEPNRTGASLSKSLRGTPSWLLRDNNSPTERQPAEKRASDYPKTTKGSIMEKLKQKLT